jgi:tRNA A37 N6-isopentenylltransferase MiaA
MATADSVIVHKHYRLDKNKIKRAQEVFETSNETEAVTRALDFAIEEHERNQIAAKAHREFLDSGIEIRDVYGKLDA